MDSAKQLGALLKLVICIFVLPVLLISLPVVGIVGSFVGGAAYGFLSPIFATFEAVDEGKDDKLFHCFIVCFVFSPLNVVISVILLLSITKISFSILRMVRGAVLQEAAWLSRM